MDLDMSIKLFRGKNIKIDNYMELKQHKIKDIVDIIGLNTYYSCLNFIILTPSENKVYLYKQGILFNEITHWDMFLSFFKNDEIKSNIVMGFNLFFGVDISNYKIIDHNITNGNHIIDEIKFSYVVSLLRESHNMDKPKIVQYANKTAVEYEIQREERRIKKGRFKPKYDLKSIMSSICWGNDINISNIEKIENLTMYQLYDAFNFKKKDKEHSNMSIGVYTGNLDSSKVNLNDVSWYNK